MPLLPFARVALMNDDDPSRSSGAPGAHAAAMIALLLLAVLVLVLLNAFFVAAEFALVRSRKAHLETDAERGQARAPHRGRA